jgi:uncharacterized protein (TIGR02231 family)
MTNSKVTRVTFFEDRAQVERVMTLRLGPGAHTLSLTELAPALDDRSLVARCDSLRVDDVAAQRRWRIGSADASGELQTLLVESNKLQLEYKALEASRARLAQHAERLQTATSLSFEALQRDLPFLPGLSRDQTAAMGELMEERRKAEEALHALEAQRLEVAARYETLRRRFEQVKNPASSLYCDVRVQVAASEDRDHTLTLQYMVPSALWRPIHRATWRGERLHFECAAAVWQATGEVWEDVETRYSTARSTQRAEPPLLSDDTLAQRPRQTKEVRAAIHEQTIQNTGAGMAAQDAVPGVDDGGEVRLMDASRRVTITSNGRMQRVPLFAFETAAKAERLARPELSPLVFLRTEQNNEAKHPLLAGPVELLRESGNVGFAQLPFIAPGEKFHLSFGGDDALRIMRQVSVRRETAMITNKQTITRETHLMLSNLNDTPAAFTLEERIPVSELEQVEVKIDTTNTGPVPAADAEGIVRFDVKLQANESARLQLDYKIIAGSDVKGL